MFCMPPRRLPLRTPFHPHAPPFLALPPSSQGAGVKLSEPGRDATGGLVEDVVFENYRITTPRYAALYINVFQEDAQPPCVLPSKPDIRNWLTVRNLTFHNVTATVDDGQAAGCFRCTPGLPCAIKFDGVLVETAGGKPAAPFVCLNTGGSAGPGGSIPAPCQ